MGRRSSRAMTPTEILSGAGRGGSSAPTAFSKIGNNVADGYWVLIFRQIMLKSDQLFRKMKSKIMNERKNQGRRLCNR